MIIAHEFILLMPVIQLKDCPSFYNDWIFSLRKTAFQFIYDFFVTVAVRSWIFLHATSVTWNDSISSYLALPKAVSKWIWPFLSLNCFPRNGSWVFNESNSFFDIVNGKSISHELMSLIDDANFVEPDWTNSMCAIK